MPCGQALNWAQLRRSDVSPCLGKKLCFAVICTRIKAIPRPIVRHSVWVNSWFSFYNSKSISGVRSRFGVAAHRVAVRRTPGECGLLHVYRERLRSASIQL